MPLWIPLVLLGLVVAAVGGMALAGRNDWPDAVAAVLFVLGVLSLFAAGVTGGIWWAGRGPARAPPRVAPVAASGGSGWGLLEFLLLGLAMAAVLFLVLFVMESRRRTLGWESHWGGFGGGLGGFRIEMGVLYLLAALGFSAMLTIISVQYLPKPPANEKQSNAQQTDTVKAARSPAAPADSAVPQPVRTDTAKT